MKPLIPRPGRPAARWLGVLLAVVAPTAGVAHAQQPLSGQPLFAPPLFTVAPSVPHYEQSYPTVEQCVAAVWRVRDSVQAMRSVVADWRQPEPAAVGTTARRCTARFRPATASPADLPMLQGLWLAAVQDSLAEATLARRLALLSAASLPADSLPLAQAELLGTALTVALRDARPARVAWAERLLDAITGLGWEARQARIFAYYSLFEYAIAVLDTSMSERYAAVMTAFADSIAPLAGVYPVAGPQALGLRYEVLQYRRLRALARGEGVEPESLAVAQLWAQSGLAAGSAPARPGTAPALSGDFWFRRGDTTAPRPTPGKSSVVVFIDDQCDSKICDSPYAVLRELGQRFGAALEITLVAHTHGFFRNYPPLEPAAEAELLRRHFLEHLGLPGALVVETTPFTRLPAPDGRRLRGNKPLPNVSRFGIEEQHGFPAGGFLLDRTGRVLVTLAEGLLSTERRLLLLDAIAGWLAGSAPRS